jgi:thioredoxin-like negative regulator of GroEL
MTIDFKKKYLKYKRKYQEAKKQKQMKGGDLKIQNELDLIMDDMKITAKEFESFVKDSTDNILVIIYAHWCYHCVNMIKHIGEHLKLDINKNRIKYLDGTTLTDKMKKNLEIRGFPTIIKIRNSFDIDNLDKIEYVGAREVVNIIEFLNE